jgi:hypothetical protein
MELGEISDSRGTNIWKVGELTPDYTAEQPRTQSFLFHRRENLKSQVPQNNSSIITFLYGTKSRDKDVS